MKKIFMTTYIFLVATFTHCVFALEMQPGEWNEQTVENTREVMKETGDIILKSHSSLPPILVCYTPEIITRLKTLKKGDIENNNNCITTWTESSKTKLNRETVCDTPELKVHDITNTEKVSETLYVVTTILNEEISTTKTVTTKISTVTFAASTCSG